MNLKSLPSVKRLQDEIESLGWCETFDIPLPILLNWAREKLDSLRNGLLNGSEKPKENEKDYIRTILKDVETRSVHASPGRLKRVINGTGTVLHTNLGRARMSGKAIRAVAEIAGGYSTLEYDPEKGERGSRHDLVSELLKELTGAEDAMVVNNNAAAVYMVLKALAFQKEVVVSRGELVEIGGSFRVSVIMEESGAVLKEVGTTNKTHAFDYTGAITENTSLLMKVHTSNFKTIGFTADVSAGELASLVKERKDIMVYEDLGSGALYPFSDRGIGEEADPGQSLKEGVDVVTFSGDKLLGGPQAGIIAGRSQIIQELKKHPLARVLRVDKMTLAALEETCKAYLMKKETDLPAVRDILASPEEIRSRVTHFTSLLNSSLISCEVVPAESDIGGGTMPGVRIPSYAADIIMEDHTASQLKRKLLNQRLPVVGRIKNDRFFLDFRTITDAETEKLAEILNHLS
ncbi:L-seryl-tRNA(Sec) selenium transferase [Alteribacter natronophilus]|uniref:L-seryl-tRNA(Sec) selenium transferase n=1 Tax=Alteribacter natronophilus TaxID=2583810 RepID=UPI00110D2E05|nr:L-seryl-tRNA(Sec) selenium transferase [Alteribacter natronophilus]TMW73324.1 L-seryl-tRNA(Sec) selenium transferase [Alteribacter natronophilus]